MDDQTSPQEPIPELALAVPQDASNLARALDLEVATVSAWLTQGLGIVARYGSRIVGLAHLVDDGGHAEVADLVFLTPDEARWFTLSRVDSATVSTAGGTGVAFRKRDRDLAKELIAETRGLLKEIEENFDDLRAHYRAALPELTARSSWKKVFDAQ